MIRLLQGNLVSMGVDYVVIVTDSGIGFQVKVPTGSFVYQIAIGDKISIHTSMQIRENDMSLYGFETEDDLNLFELLITVNGVGAKAGMAIMSVLTPSEFIRAIVDSDIKAISKANGVGKKIAQRIVLELKDKIGNLQEDFDVGTLDSVETNVKITSQREEAIMALLSLGYVEALARNAVNSIEDNNLTAEEYIRASLKKM